MLGLPEPDRASFVDLNRTRLRVWEWGDPAAAPVICAHGAGDHGRMWDGLAPGLVELGLRVVAPDLRGHGDSGRLSSGHVWMAGTLDLALLARHIGPPVGLIGHSFGAGLTMFTAGVWPELVRWMVNIDGLGPPPAAFREMEEADLAEVARRNLDAAERVLSGSVRVFSSREEMVERRRRINVRLPDPWLEHLVHHGSVPAEGGFTWKADPIFNIGFPGDFSEEHLAAEHRLVRCPVLVLTGAEHDTWSEMSDDEAAARVAAFADARHHVVPDAGHYVHVEQPARVLEEIASFLDEVGAEVAR